MITVAALIASSFFLQANTNLPDQVMGDLAHRAARLAQFTNSPTVLTSMAKVQESKYAIEVTTPSSFKVTFHKSDWSLESIEAPDSEELGKEQFGGSLTAEADRLLSDTYPTSNVNWEKARKYSDSVVSYNGIMRRTGAKVAELWLRVDKVTGKIVGLSGLPEYPSAAIELSRLSNADINSCLAEAAIALRASWIKLVNPQEQEACYQYRLWDVPDQKDTIIFNHPFLRSNVKFSPMKLQTSQQLLVEFERLAENGHGKSYVSHDFGFVTVYNPTATVINVMMGLGSSIGSSIPNSKAKTPSESIEKTLTVTCKSPWNSTKLLPDGIATISVGKSNYHVLVNIERHTILRTAASAYEGRLVLDSQWKKLAPTRHTPKSFQN